MVNRLQTTRLVLMVSKSNNDAKGNRDAVGDFPLMPRTLADKGERLLGDAQRETMGLSRQRQRQPNPNGYKDLRDEAIRVMALQMEEIT